MQNSDLTDLEIRELHERYLNNIDRPTNSIESLNDELLLQLRKYKLKPENFPHSSTPKKRELKLKCKEKKGEENSKDFS